MINKFKILFFCMIIAGKFLNAQIRYPANAKLLLLQLASSPVKPSQLLIRNTSDNSKAIPTTFLSPGFYASQLGFFCKQEIKMDKITKVPFRFRLGSVAECNRLEGKNR